MLIIVLSGLFAGSIHVLTGVDHLAAIAPMAMRRIPRAWSVGLRWGIGHASGVGVAFVLILLFRKVLNIQMLSSWSEHLVGLILIGIGVWGLHTLLRSKIHTHKHEHAGLTHEHIHVHPVCADHTQSSNHIHEHAALATGVIHGMAGSSHFLGVLPALTLPTNSESIAYMTAYGVGTISAMTIFSSIIGLLTSRFALQKETVYHKLIFGCCSMTIIIGSVWLLIKV